MGRMLPCNRTCTESARGRHESPGSSMADVRTGHRVATGGNTQSQTRIMSKVPFFFMTSFERSLSHDRTSTRIPASPGSGKASVRAGHRTA
eukprot:3629458-Rhodomonas_salina.2